MSDAAFPIEVASAESRRCGRCRTIRPLAMFYLETEARRAAREGRSHFAMPCRLCTAELNAMKVAPRLAHSDAVKMTTGCTDCGIKSDHPEIYDFDHIDADTKSGAVSTFLTKGTYEDFLAEIAKCEVVCANCHRIRTRTRKATKGLDAS